MHATSNRGPLKRVQLPCDSGMERPQAQVAIGCIDHLVGGHIFYPADPSDSVWEFPVQPFLHE